jgi:eukaryotic-like serine/threonine-protein kinase
MPACPTPDTLSRLASNSSCDSRFTTMEAHIQMCTDCQGVLERLAALPSLAPERGPGRQTEAEQPPTIPGFVIEGLIGRGGMAVVYRAWQPQLARHVAIKIVSASAGIGVEDRRRWLREAQAIGRVRHPNVVQLHDAGEQDGCLYLVLDLIAGGSLADRLTGPLPARVAVALMATVARAVDQVHQAGMLHLDIKPSNILLDGVPDGPWDQVTPMIADFGIARAGDDPGTTTTGLIGVRGTPSFMAPEQIAGDRALIGPRSDVFALGATLYSLLTGRPPFQAASVIETLDLVRTREPALLRTLVSGLSRDVETIALTCLRKDPRRRYASARALADDLERWLDGFTIRARPVSKLEHAGRWCRRRPAFASLLAVFAFTAASSLVGLLTLWRHSESERARAENALARAVESDKAMSATVRELVGLLATTVDAPQMLASERFQETSHAVRELTAKLRRQRGFAASNLVAVCEIERQLAEDFVRRGNFAESRTLFMDSLDLLEERRYDANDEDVELAYARALRELGWVAQKEKCFDEALAWTQRAEHVLEGLVHDPRNWEAIELIDQSRATIASLFGRRGLEEPRRKLLESHIRMLERLSELAGGDPATELLATLVRLDLAPDDGASAKLRTAIQRFPANRRPPAWLEHKVARWIAGDVNLYPSGPNSTSESTVSLDPHAHADAMIRALESRCAAFGVDRSWLPTASLEVAAIAGVCGAEQRRAGHLDDARQTAACLSAFAKLLVRNNPRNAAFHLLLSSAFVQESKNAWQVDDFTAIEAAYRNALGEACTALRLDPRSADARINVANLQDRLVGLASGRRKNDEGNRYAANEGSAAAVGISSQ